MYRNLIALCCLLAPMTAAALDLTAMETKLKPSVVHLSSTDGAGEERGNGTGFLIDAKGFVVTNHHVSVIEGDLVAVFADGTKHRVLGLLADDEENDLAILQIEGDGYPVLALGDPATVKVGDNVTVLGSPMGLSFTLSSGNVSATRRWKDIPENLRGDRARETRLVQFTAPISPGSSGSPLVDQNGIVIGVVASHIRGAENINFAISVEHLLALRAKVGPTTVPEPLHSSVGRNLAISAAFFAALGLLSLVPTLLARYRERRRPKATPARPSLANLKS